MTYIGIRCAGFLLTVAGMISSAAAETPGRHPAYLHALSDLRYARALLSRPEEIRVARDQRAATAMIDKAIYELKQASYDDRKRLEDYPPVDAGMLRAGRIQRSIELLTRALRDIEREEDNPAARAWRNSAIHYIRESIAFSEKAARDKRRFE